MWLESSTGLLCHAKQLRLSVADEGSLKDFEQEYRTGDSVEGRYRRN